MEDDHRPNFVELTTNRIQTTIALSDFDFFSFSLHLFHYLLLSGIGLEKQLLPSALLLGELSDASENKGCCCTISQIPEKSKFYVVLVFEMGSSIYGVGG